MSMPNALDSEEWVLMESLPRGHPLRVAPLSEVAAQCRNKKLAAWREVAKWRIGTTAYDQLGAVWTDCNEFRMPAQTSGGGT